MMLMVEALAAAWVRLIEKFPDNTVPGGYLFIGHSETINRDGNRYRYVLPACYRKPL